MKNRIFLLLGAVAVLTGCQSTQAPSEQTSKFRTCKSFDGPFQIPTSQQCPLSGYAQGSGVPVVIEGKPKAATPAP
ncbi:MULTISPECIES: lipoprotein [unclassified Mesorhizobium]|uniref:lipoprotein n=1 Tax=unclassified Mesorhizobium TaxID=325217 RepID=UPI00333CD874